MNLEAAYIVPETAHRSVARRALSMSVTSGGERLCRRATRHRETAATDNRQLVKRKQM